MLSQNRTAESVMYRFTYFMGKAFLGCAECDCT